MSINIEPATGITNYPNLNPELPSQVRKRDGRIVAFDLATVINAVQKAFSAVTVAESSTIDIDQQMSATQVALAVLAELGAQRASCPSVEEIQDTVEQTLMRFGHTEVAKAYILYRQDRSQARELDSRLMRTFEDLVTSTSISDSRRENANVNAHTAMGTMLQYGSESAKHYNLLRVLKPEHASAHTNGDIHIHDLDFLTLTMTCCQISLRDLFRHGFSTGHGVLRPPRGISSYASLACIAIQSNQNDQHGGQSIPNFDFDLADGVRFSYRSSYRLNLRKALVLLAPEIDASAVIETLASSWEQHPPQMAASPAQTTREVSVLAEAMSTNLLPGEQLTDVTAKAQAICQFTHQEALTEVDRATYQAMEALIHNLNTMNSRAGAQTPFSSINYGTDTSPEGRMVMRNILLATEAGLGRGETAIFPIQIFRVQEGVNFNPGDPNYDLFQLACRCSAKRLFPNFSFQDAPFNAQYYRPGKPETEIAYMGCRTRVIGNVADSDRQITHGRGNLSFTSINLPRLAIEADHDITGFFTALDHKLDLVIDQLVDRYQIQCRRQVRNFPFLMGQGVWLDSANLNPDDEVASVLVHGTLSIGFIGLAETLTSLIGTHHGADPKAQELGLTIVKHMRARMDLEAQRTGLNFSLLASPAEGLSGRFVRLDKARYGLIEGVTDKDYYTNSFHIPVGFSLSAAAKISIEAPYHALTNAGHITYVELDGDPSRNLVAFESIVRHMAASGVGYGSINHPIDRDPVCGYTGCIDDQCPSCGRLETSAAPFDRIRRITGYLVGTLDRFNDAKRAEVNDRVRHTTSLN